MTTYQTSVNGDFKKIHPRFLWLFIVAVAGFDYFVFFSGFDEFFQADTLYWLQYPYDSVADFLKGFLTPDPSGWYRPLTNRTIPSLLYPTFGLDNPAVYRIILVPIFLANSIAVFKLSRVMGGSLLAACLSLVLFNTHSTNAFTTFAVALIPELLYTLFYLLAVIFFVRYLRGGDWRSHLASGICTVASLFSKESAVTLPLALLFVAFLFCMSYRRETFGTRSLLEGIISAVKDTRTHLFLLSAYLLFVVGWLGAGRTALSTLLSPAESVDGSGYHMVLGWPVLENFYYAISWAFNIPVGWHGQSRGLSPWMIGFTMLFAVVVGSLMLFWAIKGPRGFELRAGLGLFLIALLPALPLMGHFLPYYLLLPLAGFSVALGSTIERLYLRIKELNRHFAVLVIALSLSLMVAISAISASNDQKEHRMLGYSSRLARMSVESMRAQHPQVPVNSVIFISNDDSPDLPYFHGGGGLFRLMYNDPSIRVLYSSNGDYIPLESSIPDSVIFMRYEAGLLSDSPPIVGPREPPPARSSRFVLSVSSDEVKAGGGSYTLRIAEASNVEAQIRYRFNQLVAVQQFSVQLDRNGEIEFKNVSPVTPQGLYTFVGFKLVGQTDWIQANATIRVD